MFENSTLIDKTTENLPSLVLAGKDSNAITMKFISQLQAGKIFDAVFLGKLPGGKGALSLEGNKVIVELPKTLDRQNEKPVFFNKGQAITVRVESSGPKPALKIVSPPSNPLENKEVTTSLTHRGKSIARLFSFDEFPQSSNSQKHVTNARVSHVLDTKSLVVEAGGKNFIVPVENAKSFKPGSQVRVHFERTENGRHSVLVKTDGTKTMNSKVDFAALKPYLSARMPVTKMAYLLKNEILDSPLIPELKIKSDVIARLQDTLRLHLPREGEIPNATQVRKQVESSGINYEAKVRQVLEFPAGQQARNELASDLKGLLLELSHSTEQAGVSQKKPGLVAEFRQIIKYAIDNIELNQLSSQVSKQENQPLVVQIPNPLSPGNKTIQLFIRKDEGKSKDQKKSYNVAFFLDLSFLGKIKINARMDRELLSVRIDVESETIAGFIRNKTNDLKEKMNECGVKTSVECSVIHKVQPEKDGLTELMVNHKTSLVNIRT